MSYYEADAFARWAGKHCRPRPSGRSRPRAGLLDDAFGDRVAVDAQRLLALSGLPPGARRARRVQRQVHGQPDGAARRLARDARAAMRADATATSSTRRARWQFTRPPARGLRRSDCATDLVELGMTALTDAVLALGAAKPSPTVLRPTCSRASARRRSDLAGKYFYDAGRLAACSSGSRELPEYYPTRTELRHPARPCAARSPRCVPRAPRSSSSAAAPAAKARLLLERAAAARAPTCRSTSRPNTWTRRRRGCGAISRASRSLPVAADFTAPFALPPPSAARRARRLLPGLDHRQLRAARTRRDFLRQRRAHPGPAARRCIIGVDLVKDAARAQRRLQRRRRRHGARSISTCWRASNRELGGRLRSGRLRAPRLLQRAEQPHRDASRQPQAPDRARARPSVRLRAPARRSTPRTATSTRSTGSRALAARACWRAEAAWTDADELFSVHALRAKGVTLQ